MYLLRGFKIRMSENGKLRILLFMGSVILAIVTGGFGAALAFNGRISALERGQEDTDRRLQRIEDKIDQLLQQR